MKTLIKSDFWIQVVIFSGSLVAGLFDFTYCFVGFYFGLGGWQLLMALAHLSMPFATQSKGRKRYQITLLVVALINGLALLIDGELYFGVAMGMLVVGPIMAFWNMAISFEEGEKLRKPHTVWDIA